MTEPVFRRVIAAFQIIGSSAALVLILSSLNPSALNVLTVLLLLIMLAIFAVAFLAGIWLWNGEQRGFRYSLAVQALQIPFIATTVLSYKMVFGFGMTLVFVGAPVDMFFELGSRSNLYLNMGGDQNQFGLNLFPPIAIAYLLKDAKAAPDLD